MTVDVYEATRAELDRWDEYVERSGHGSPFHQREALSILATHADAELHPLVGFKGEEPVGLFPLFSVSKGPLTGAFSPPPRLNVPFLGPVMLNMGKLKQRKRERRRKQFVDGVFDWLESTLDPQYTQLVVSYRYDDVRPFVWRDCTLTPWYTYVIDLTDGVDELLGAFSSDARRNIRDGDGVAFDIEAGDADTARRIIRQVQDRYEQQGRPYGVTTGFVTDLYERLPRGQIRPYACRVDGQFVGGIVALEYGDTVYRWQGGVRPGRDLDLAVNDKLDWRIMCDAVDRGVDRYDLVGAGKPRINEYKSKFNPALSSSYRIQSGSWPTTALVDIYKRLS